MKSGCTYRLVIYKGTHSSNTGIQKIDEMSEGIKGKLIGGRIVFEQCLLNFYLPVYTPTRNIEFTVKVFDENGVDVIRGVGVGASNDKANSASNLRTPLTTDKGFVNLNMATLTPYISGAGDGKSVMIEIILGAV